MKLEKGKFYKTKDGNKVKIYEVYADKAHGAIFVLGGTWIMLSWTQDGKRRLKCDSPKDIISEWEEPIAKGRGNNWYSYPNQPKTIDDRWSNSGGIYVFIEEDYRPKNFVGSWEDSLFENPKYKK